MDAPEALRILARFEHFAGERGNSLRAALIEVEDYIVRMQRENVELRRENQALHRRLSAKVQGSK